MAASLLAGGWAAPLLATPDLSGIWQVERPYSLTSPLPMAPIDGGNVPMQPWNRALKESEIYAQRVLHDAWSPNNQRCLVAGTVRAMKGNFPWRLIQTDKQVVVLFEEDNRVNLFPFKPDHDPKAKPTWWGDPIARWDGDTLVVDVTKFNGKTPFPEGIHHTTLLHVTHQFRLIDGGKRLEDRITVDDPGAFTRTFTAMSIFSRMPEDYRLADYRCAENNRNLPEQRDWWRAYWGPD